jgi:hypothetical protein
VSLKNDAGQVLTNIVKDAKRRKINGPGFGRGPGSDADVEVVAAYVYRRMLDEAKGTRQGLAFYGQMTDLLREACPDLEGMRPTNIASRLSRQLADAGLAHRPKGSNAWIVAPEGEQFAHVVDDVDDEEQHSIVPHNGRPKLPPVTLGDELHVVGLRLTRDLEVVLTVESPNGVLEVSPR